MNRKMTGMLAGILMGGLAFTMVTAASEDITGEWYLSVMRFDAGEYRPSDLGTEIKIVLNEDGTMEIVSSSEDSAETGEGTWEEDGDRWTMYAEGDMLYFTLEDDVLLLVPSEEPGEGEVTEMEFTREKPTSAELAPAIADASLEDFNGAWILDTIFVRGQLYPAGEFWNGSIRLAIEDGTVAYQLWAGDDEEGEPVQSFVSDGTFQDGILSVERSEDNDYTGLMLQLREDGTLTHVAIDPERMEELKPEEMDDNAEFAHIFVKED